MTEIYHPSTLTDDYGNTWVKNRDGDYDCGGRFTGWTLDEVRKVYGVSSDQTPEVVRVEHEHNWISIRQLGDPHTRQMCNCGERRILVDDAIGM